MNVSKGYIGFRTSFGENPGRREVVEGAKTALGLCPIGVVSRMGPRAHVGQCSTSPIWSN